MVYSRKYGEFYKSDIELNYIFSNDDICFNFDNWENGKSNALFITGMHGSGKSTLATNLLADYQCEYVTLDIFTDCENLNIIWVKYYQPLVYEYFHNIDQIESEPIIYSDRTTVVKELINFIKWLVYKNKKKVIIEGSELFKILIHSSTRNSNLLQVPIIFKHTSIIQSMFRKLIKDYKHNNIINSVLHLSKYYKDVIKEYKLALRRILKANNGKYEFFIQ